MRHPWVWVLLIGSLMGCDTGLSPPEPVGFGTIRGEITYLGEWPGPDQQHDLRFVAMRFIPQDTTDFLQLNRMAISPGLRFNVEADTFEILQAQAGDYLYSGVALRFADDLLSWRPLGLYVENGGEFTVYPGETVSLALTVDFDHPPVFPPR